ncbi:MAG: 4Fe-4S binding protein [Firmicutes bacterium]|nr:4Fe-4S binding protein [Bacillota bacterium]
MSTVKELILNTAWCKGCGICAAFCPKHALEVVDGKVRKVEGAECVLCGQCELRCPDYALYIDEKEGGQEQWVKSY